MRTYKTGSVDVDANALHRILFKKQTFRDDDIVIVFIGPTGSGKSHIIDTLTGEKGRRSGNGLKSVTQDLEASRIENHERYGSRIVLVDTPGFDHTNRTDEYTLKLTGEWLKKTYEKQILSGIVYVQRITDTRMSTANYRNLLMFAELPCSRIAKNLVLATTMWDKLSPEFDDGNKQEQTWKEEYWNDMIPHGATVERFLNGPESAWNIIDNVVNRKKNEHGYLHRPPAVKENTKQRAEKLSDELEQFLVAGSETDELLEWLTHDADNQENPRSKSSSSLNHTDKDDHLKTPDLSPDNSSSMGTYKTTVVNTALFSHSSRKFGDDDIIIAFIGLTGSGKSQIVDILTGQQGQRARESLQSVTKNLQASRILDHERYGSRLVLVDTPGFDDMERKDVDILKLIGKWLKKTYEKRILLSGIVYVQRITDIRMAAAPHRNLLMFAELTGSRAAEKVVLATTMWDKLHPDTLDKGAESKREQSLKKEYWKDMIKDGATVKRFLNTSDSAWSIVDNVVNRNENGQKTGLQFQVERVDEKKSLKETRAFAALYLPPPKAVVLSESVAAGRSDEE